MFREPAVVELSHPPLGITPEYLHQLSVAALSAYEAAVIAKWTRVGEAMSNVGKYKVSPEAAACFDLERCKELSEKGELTVGEVPVTLAGERGEASIVFSTRDGICRAHVTGFAFPVYEPEGWDECPHYEGEGY